MYVCMVYTPCKHLVPVGVRMGLLDHPLDQLPTQLDLILVRKVIHTKQLISERSSKVPYKGQHLNYRYEQTSDFYPFLCICSPASLLCKLQLHTCNPSTGMIWPQHSCSAPKPQVPSRPGVCSHHQSETWAWGPCRQAKLCVTW